MIVRMILGVGCLIMGVLTLAGLFMRNDPSDRWIVGIGWLLIGGGWLIRCYIGKRRSGSGGERRPDDKDGR